ncbi:MAG: PilN domain-containing protein, partial [Smithella sp.]
KIANNYKTGTKTSEACRTFCAELKNTVEYMKINGILQNDPARIILTGGGSLFNPLHQELQSIFSSDMEVLNFIHTKQLEIEKNIQNKFSAQIMNTAIAAALRLSSGKKSFNFRQGDFAAKNTNFNFKKQLKWAGILAGIIIALAVFNQLFDYGLKTKRLNVLKKQIAYTFKKNVPEATSMVDPVQQLRGRLAENKKTFGFYEDLPETTAIELLKEISRLVSPSVNIIITGMIYEKGIISLKGEAKTIDEITVVKNDLSRSKYFQDVTMGSTSLTKDGGKVEFDLRIQVK